jgi:hypothetical protein
VPVEKALSAAQKQVVPEQVVSESAAEVVEAAAVAAALTLLLPLSVPVPYRMQQINQAVELFFAWLKVQQLITTQQVRKGAWKNYLFM